MKLLRIGPFKTIDIRSDITYESVNQDGYTSHFHRNHLVPYYPKDPIIFPLRQQYNPYSNNDGNDNIDSNINDPIEPFDSFSGEEQSVEDEDHTFTDSNIETDIPSTIDIQPESFNQYSPFLGANKIYKNQIIPIPYSCDESLTTQNTVQDTSSILNRPPLPPIPTTRTLHIPDPSSVLQYINSCPHSIPTATKHLEKLLYQHYQRTLLYHQQVKPQ